MIIDTTNAVNVAKLLKTLADERFTMRTFAGIRKAAGGDEALTDALLANFAGEMGMRIRRRIRDDAALIERPLPPTELAALIAKVEAVTAGTQEAFEVDFAPVELPEALPTNDVLGDVERNLGNVSGDEDEQFQS